MQIICSEKILEKKCHWKALSELNNLHQALDGDNTVQTKYVAKDTQDSGTIGFQKRVDNFIKSAAPKTISLPPHISSVRRAVAKTLLNLLDANGPDF